jgi:hypothetical protein
MIPRIIPTILICDRAGPRPAPQAKTKKPENDLGETSTEDRRAAK